MAVDAGDRQGDDPAVGVVPPTRGIADRAASGALLLAGRTVAVRAVGLVGSVVLARVLVPKDFGILALGLTLTTVVGLLGSVGLGAGVVRRPEEPDRRDLQTVMTATVIITASVVPVLVALIPVFGTPVAIAALMASAIPIQALRSPDGMVLERHLSYGAIARVDIVETLLYTFASVTLVLLGAGVWGVAAASPLRAAIGTLLMWRLGPVGRLALGFSRRRARVLLGEGSTFAAQDLVGLVRDQGFNILIGALGGLSALGAWSLQARVMTIPGLVLSALWQVTFPAMSRGQAVMDDAKVRRTLGLTAVGLGVPLAPLIGASQSAVPVVFGPGWADVAATVPLAAAGLLVGGPTSVALGSRLFAERRGGVVVGSAVAHSVVMFVLLAALWSDLGLRAAGVAACGSALVEVVVFTWAVGGDRLGFLTAAGRPAAAAAGGGLVGLLVGEWLPEDLLSLLVEGVASLAVCLALMLVLAPAATRDFTSLALTSLGRGRRQEDAHDPPGPQAA